MAVPLRCLFFLARRWRWLVLAAVWLTLLDRGWPADPRPAPAETKKVEIHRLTNEELLKQAAAIYEKASRDYLAQLRALASAEALLEEIRKQTEAGNVASFPAVDRAAAPPAGEHAAKEALDAARANQARIQQQRKRIQTQKELLDRVTARLEECRPAAVAFQNALDDLKAYVLESGLRVKDGSLLEDRVPVHLKPEYRDRKKRELRDELARLKAKAADVPQGQEAVARLLDRANKAVLAANAEVIEAAKNLAREQQRRELEKRYTGKKPDEMVAELARMGEEGVGLKGTYELALRKFDGRAKESSRLRQALDALKRPDTQIPQLARAEDMEMAAMAIQKLIGFYAARSNKIQELRTALVALVREGGDFEADAAVSQEHLFKMQVLAKLLKKNGVAEEKLPAKARTTELDRAAVRQQQSAAAVRAATEKAKAAVVLLDRQRVEARAAEKAAAKQLANLKESRDVTLAALQWEGRLKTMTGPQVVAAFTVTRKELADHLGKLKGEAGAYHKALAVAAEAKTRRDGLKDPFLRTAEEQGQAEKLKIIAELQKEAGLERVAQARGPPAGTAKKVDPDKKPKPDTRTDLEKLAGDLYAFQQLLAGRVRVLDERKAKKTELLAALADLRKKAVAYAKTLADARLLALELNATAVDLKKRFGKGELPGDALPEGLTDALRLELRSKLDTTARSVLDILNTLQQDQGRLLRPNPDGEALLSATKELLTIVGRRLDLLADLKRLAADYQREKSALPPSETKRLEQRAAERLAAESSGWDALLGIDSSKPARNLAALLETYYREWIEIEDKEKNLKMQRVKVEQLLELTRKEAAVLDRMFPLLARQAAQLDAVREEESVLAHARLRPDRAEELLAAHQTKTGRLLSKPLPLADKDLAAKIEEMGNLLFERYVRVEAAKAWSDVLNARIAPKGTRAEAGAYQDELARRNAASAANARRVHALTGREEPGPATGGDIGRAREELARVRTQGVKRIGLLIAGILLAALLLPRLLSGILWRLMGGAAGQGSSLVFSALRAVLKATVWVAAVTWILSLLGVNVTAIIAGLGIGGLAVGLAAQPMIADVIAAVVIFAERRVKIGDVIRLGGDDPARLVGLTWRSTQVKNADGLLVTIPNRKVTEATIQNLTKAGGTFDSLNVILTTQNDVARVLAVIRRTLEECEPLVADHGVSVREFNQKGETKTIKYRFAWFLRDYETRNRTRDEVFARLTASLAHEDMVGTEISLA